MSDVAAEAMEQRLQTLPARPRGEGVRQIVLYNWPTYLVGLAVALVLAATALLLPLPAWSRLAGGAMAFLLVAGEAGSILVSHLVYDRSRLHRWTWLARQVPHAASWAVVHAGIDEASAPLGHIYPEARGIALDIFDARSMSEPGIRIARAAGSSPVAVRAAHDSLPLAGGGTDLVVILFAAHELRDPVDRAALMAEVRRVLSPHGRAVVVEHLRDAANALAYGPGVLHFFPRRAWHRSFFAGGLAIAREERITPFVRAFFLTGRP
jgi:SAM-dependent methyltransferase